MKYIASALLALLMLLSVFSTLAESKPTSYTLLGSESIPAPLNQSMLDEQQIQGLIHASQDELKAQISTFADYVAWIQALDSYYWLTVTSDNLGTIRIGGDFNINWVHSMLGSSMIADLCFQFLQDDYPGMKTVMTVSYIGRDSYISFSNAFPVDGGYIILGADSFAANTLANGSGPATHGPIFVEDLSAVIDYAKGNDALWGQGGALSQVMIIHSDEHIAFSVEDQLYIPDNPAFVETLYMDMDVLPGLPSLADYGIILPEQPESTVTNKEIANVIRNGTVEEAAEKINTIQDFMNYVYFAKYICGDGDKFIRMRNNLQWHFNYKPHVVFARNTGCCGATSGLIAYLLENDYEEVGIVGITYSEGFGGGHVINYIKHCGMYYVFDVFGWGQSNYSEWGLRMCCNESLKEACLEWANRTGEVQCMYTYTNPALGDAPVGWGAEKHPRSSYLIKGYAENIQIHMENPEEGYIYEFVEVAPEVLQAIELVRSIW